MRRDLVSVLAAFALVLAAAAPVLAVKPSDRGCTDDFDLWYYHRPGDPILDFREYMNSADFYWNGLTDYGRELAVDILSSINSPDWLVVSASFDKNGDGQLCIKQKPRTKGNLGGWIFNAVDNPSNH